MRAVVETPNSFIFSEAAKAYLLADRLLPRVGMTFGYPSARGTLVDHRSLAKGIIAVTIEWLARNRYVELRQAQVPALLGSVPVIVVRPIAQGAPGFSARFLEATGWAECDLTAICQKLLRTDRAPMMCLLDDVSQEFAQAGILTRGGYAAHGNVWNPEWLQYLQDGWFPETSELWATAHARSDFPLIHKNLMHAVAARQYTPRDFDD